MWTDSMMDTMNSKAGHPDMLPINNSVQWEQSHCMWTDSMTDTMNSKAGHPDMLQINNYVITVDTTKCVFNDATCFDLFLTGHHQATHILYT